MIATPAYGFPWLSHRTTGQVYYARRERMIAARALLRLGQSPEDVAEQVHVPVESVRRIKAAMDGAA